jgi:uncharacterized protein (DUF849 family)
VNTEVMLTCAITGDADTAGRHPALPITPKQMASAIEAAAVAASAVHIQVRGLDTGSPSHDLKYHLEVGPDAKEVAYRSPLGYGDRELKKLVILSTIVKNTILSL